MPHVPRCSLGAANKPCADCDTKLSLAVKTDKHPKSQLQRWREAGFQPQRFAFKYHYLPSPIPQIPCDGQQQNNTGLHAAPTKILHSKILPPPGPAIKPRASASQPKPIRSVTSPRIAHPLGSTATISRFSAHAVPCVNFYRSPLRRCLPGTIATFVARLKKSGLEEPIILDLCTTRGRKSKFFFKNKHATFCIIIIIIITSHNAKHVSLYNLTCPTLGVCAPGHY